jgi:hypothetical protein
VTNEAAGGGGAGTAEQSSALGRHALKVWRGGVLKI